MLQGRSTRTIEVELDNRIVAAVDHSYNSTSLIKDILRMSRDHAYARDTSTKELFDLNYKQFKNYADYKRSLES